jgi:hypothetical protein
MGGEPAAARRVSPLAHQRSAVPVAAPVGGGPGDARHNRSRSSSGSGSGSDSESGSGSTSGRGSGSDTDSDSVPRGRVESKRDEGVQDDDEDDEDVVVSSRFSGALSRDGGVDGIGRYRKRVSAVGASPSSAAGGGMSVGGGMAGGTGVDMRVGAGAGAGVGSGVGAGAGVGAAFDSGDGAGVSGAAMSREHSKGDRSDVLAPMVVPRDGGDNRQRVRFTQDTGAAACGAVAVVTGVVCVACSRDCCNSDVIVVVRVPCSVPALQ